MVPQVSSRAAWEALRRDAEARLVDVRTPAEWQTVGVPDLRDAGKDTILISWQSDGGTAANARFVESLGAAGLTPDQTLYFICRSGARSDAAARCARAAGYGAVVNVADGFEGPPDAMGRRGAIAGWQAEGLPSR